LRSILVAILLLVCASAAHAGDCDVTLSSMGDDAVDLLASPFHMDRGETVRVLSVAAAVGATMMWWDDDFDRAARDYPQEYPYALIHYASIPTRWYGESSTHALITAVAVTGAVGLGGWIADDDEIVQTSAIMAESAAFTVGLTYLGKMIFGRARPRVESGPHSFDFFTPPQRDEHLSFPSGHASTAWALAGAAASRHPHWYVRLPAYSFAVSAALQRVDARNHWMSDVIAGSVLGLAVSQFLSDRHTCPPGTDSGDEATATVAVTFAF